MGLDYIDSPQFGVVLRGYDRGEVDAFLGSLTRELAERDALVAAREAKLAEHRQRHQEAAALPDRRTLLRRLGQEAAAALERADKTGAQRDSDAEAAAERIRRALGRAAERLAGTQRAVAHLLSYVESAALAPTSERVIDLTVGQDRSSPGATPSLAAPQVTPAAPAEERAPVTTLPLGHGEEPTPPAVTPKTLSVPGDTGITLALFGLSTLAWALIVRGTATMRGMATGLGQIGPAAPSTMSTATVILAWVGVTATVMWPSLVPGWAVGTGPSRPFRSRMRVAAAYSAGFLAVWAGLGLVPILAVSSKHSPAGSSGGIGAPSILAGLVLAAAGLYQFTPWKRRSLSLGAGPLGFLLEEAPEWTNGAAFQAGLETAIRRVPGSGPLLAVLLVVGLVNPAWLLILALVVAVETRTAELAFSWAVGAVLFVLGVVSAVSPGVLHALSGV